jgi:WD40 repeat protein
MKLWNVATGVCEMTINGYTSAIIALVVIDKLRICINSRCHDTALEKWNISSGVRGRTLEGNTSYVKDMVLLSDGGICSLSRPLTNLNSQTSVSPF